jgi:hypothetical protein
MISLLITLLIVLIVAAVVFWIIGLLPIPQPWLNIIRAVIGLILLIWILMYFLPAGHLLR